MEGKLLEQLTLYGAPPWRDNMEDPWIHEKDKDLYVVTTDDGVFWEMGDFYEAIELVDKIKKFQQCMKNAGNIIESFERSKTP